MLRGQGGYKIRLELAIRSPGCPLKFAELSAKILLKYITGVTGRSPSSRRSASTPLSGMEPMNWWPTIPKHERNMGVPGPQGFLTGNSLAGLMMVFVKAFLVPRAK